MEAEAPIDCAVFLLTPTRTRCEIVVSRGDHTEKLASSVPLDPFAAQIKAVSEGVDKGGCSIKLEPSGDDDDDAASWFTKGTIQRFISFVNAPDVLEDVSSIEKLDENFSRNNDTASSGAGSPVSGINQSSLADEQGNAELQFKALQKESLAFAKADAAGFNPNTAQNLMKFARHFGANRLSVACESYLRLYEKSLGGSRSDSVNFQESNHPFEEFDKETSSEAVLPDHEQATGRRTSVQEKITMFESKKKGIEDRRRMSVADITRTDTQKPVLRRWSLAAGKVAQRQSGTHRKGKDIENSSQASETSADGVDGGAADEKGLVSVAPPGETTKPVVQAEQASDDQKSVQSETQSLKKTKGRLYDAYRDRRDAKLREEGTSKRAEKQARLKLMQENLDRRRAEVAKSMRSTKVDPLAEARVRAEKLRAFKAGLLELRKAKEEEEHKRLEELRMQRLQKKMAAAAQTPVSPHAVASTPKLLPTRAIPTSKGLLPTFQRSSSSAGGVQSSRGRRSESVQQEVKGGSKRAEAHPQSKLPVLRRSVPSADAMRRSSSMGAGAGQRRDVCRLSHDSTASMGLKLLNAAPAVNELEEVSLPAAGGVEVTKKEEEPVVIRAPVTVDDDLLPVARGESDELPREKNSNDDPDPSPSDYVAPLAPVSISPMILQVE